MITSSWRPIVPYRTCSIQTETIRQPWSGSGPISATTTNHEPQISETIRRNESVLARTQNSSHTKSPITLIVIKLSMLSRAAGRCHCDTKPPKSFALNGGGLDMGSNATTTTPQVCRNHFEAKYQYTKYTIRIWMNLTRIVRVTTQRKYPKWFDKWTIMHNSLFVACHPTL